VSGEFIKTTMFAKFVYYLGIINDYKFLISYEYTWLLFIIIAYTFYIEYYET